MQHSFITVDITVDGATLQLNAAGHLFGSAGGSYTFDHVNIIGGSMVDIYCLTSICTFLTTCVQLMAGGDINQEIGPTIHAAYLHVDATSAISADGLVCHF